MAKTVKKTVRKKKRERKNIEKGQAHIQSTFNNTLVTLTDMEEMCIRDSFRPSGKVSDLLFCTVCSLRLYILPFKVLLLS